MQHTGSDNGSMQKQMLPGEKQLSGQSDQTFLKHEVQ